MKYLNKQPWKKRVEEEEKDNFELILGNCKAIKLRSHLKKVCSLLGQNRKPSTGMHLMKIKKKIVIKLKFFKNRNLLL